MFRCSRGGAGFSPRRSSGSGICPRCLAKDQVKAPLRFDLGWGASREGEDPSDRRLVNRAATARRRLDRQGLTSGADRSFREQAGRPASMSGGSWSAAGWYSISGS
jgi:hypothetical protein